MGFGWFFALFLLRIHDEVDDPNQYIHTQLLDDEERGVGYGEEKRREEVWFGLVSRRRKGLPTLPNST